ncbi:MAG: TetR family transcriptional regulator, partial [Actinomycetota bacterium]|nr:TetR family transcriptional regulator [Actinomycetota bacterium]
MSHPNKDLQLVGQIFRPRSWSRAHAHAYDYQKHDPEAHKEAQEPDPVAAYLHCREEQPPYPAQGRPSSKMPTSKVGQLQSKLLSLPGQLHTWRDQSPSEGADITPIDGLSMRAVANQLGAGAATLYWHVDSKDGLIELVIDRVFAQIELPPPDPDRWQDQLKEVALEARRVFQRYRGVGALT